MGARESINYVGGKGVSLLIPRPSSVGGEEGKRVWGVKM